jgi:branched-chain amino acid transport system ATP-binding protein
MDKSVQLKVEDITLSFGGVTALSGVSFEVRQGEIFSIIGPNGAGKTSMLNCVSGRYHPQRGTILFEHHDVTDRPPAARARLGIARTFQNIALFKGMTVLDNLLIGRHIHLKNGFLRGGLYLGPCQKEEIAHRRFVEDIVDFLEIEHIRKRTVGTLAYGLQKRVELARALALDPKLILLDEPMAGMNLEETEDMVRFILDINQERGITVILVEHDMGVVMDISDRLVVLDFGQKIGEGTPEEVQKNPDVVRAYLGGEASVFLGR